MPTVLKAFGNRGKPKLREVIFRTSLEEVEAGLGAPREHGTREEKVWWAGQQTAVGGLTWGWCGAAATKEGPREGSAREAAVGIVVSGGLTRSGLSGGAREPPSAEAAVGPPDPPVGGVTQRQGTPWARVLLRRAARWTRPHPGEPRLGWATPGELGVGGAPGPPGQQVRPASITEHVGSPEAGRLPAEAHGVGPSTCSLRDQGNGVTRPWRGCEAARGPCGNYQARAGSAAGFPGGGDRGPFARGHPSARALRREEPPWIADRAGAGAEARPQARGCRTAAGHPWGRRWQHLGFAAASTATLRCT